MPLFTVILISWALAFAEYCLAVPANRYRRAVYSAAQLKTIQEVVTLTIFAVFSIASGAFFVFPGAAVKRAHFAGATRRMRPASLSVSR
jgi:uncharacterized protein (DUF486 family)